MSEKYLTASDQVVEKLTDPWHLRMTPEAAIDYVESHITSDAGGYVIELQDPDGTNEEQKALVERLATGDARRTSKQALSGKNRSGTGGQRRHIEIGDPEHEEVDDVVARLLRAKLQRENNEKGLKALAARDNSSSQTYRRQSLSRAANATEEPPAVLIAATSAGSWMGASEQAYRATNLVKRRAWLRIILIGKPEETVYERRDRWWSFQIERKRGPGDDEAKEILKRGEALLETICHDIAMAQGNAWKTKLCGHWAETYIFRARERDEYQRSLNARGARALAEACATALGISEGLFGLGRSKQNTMIMRAGGRPAKIMLHRTPKYIDLSVHVRRSAEQAYRGRTTMVKWPADGNLAHNSYGACALRCIGRLLQHRTTDETAELFNKTSTREWDGQGTTLEEMRAMLKHEGVEAQIAYSAGEVYMHCRNGGTAIMGIRDPSHGTHALIRTKDQIADPGNFTGLGRLWCAQDPDVVMYGAVLIVDSDNWTGDFTQDFSRHIRPEYTRARHNVWDTP